MSSTESPRLARLLAPITEVRPGEAVTALLLALNVFLLLTAYYLIKPVREALILSLESGAEYKAYMSAVIAAVLVFAVRAYAWLVDRLPRNVLLVGVTLSFALELLLFFAASLSDALRSQLGLVFFLWVGIFNMMVVAQFWAYANDLYTEEEGERLFPLVALGAVLGGVVGAKAAGLLIPRFNVFPMLLIGALLLCACAALFWLIDRRERGRTSHRGAAPTRASGAFQLVVSDRYLRLVALFALIFSCVNTNGEYMLGKLVKAAAESAASGAEAQRAYIGAFYGNFFFDVNVLSFALQSLLVSRLIRRLGFRWAFLILPLIVVANSLTIALLPLLMVVRVGKALENATDYSLNNTLRQMLWLVTSREMKYKAKQAVDTFFVRMGDVGSGVLVWGAAAVLGWGVRRFALINLALALVWVVLAVLIAREHSQRSAANTAAP